MVTCARTRGSTMMFLPVAAATASMTWVMSASLKFGVMRCACDWASAGGVTPPMTRPSASAANRAVVRRGRMGMARSGRTEVTLAKNRVIPHPAP